MSDIENLHSKINDRFSHSLQSIKIENDELTIELAPNQLITVATSLRDDTDLAFNLLLDVCGVDYLHYGLSEWETNSATATGFERGVDRTEINNASKLDRLRFAVVYHLLSTIHNHRIRLRVFLVENASPLIDSVFEIWPSANWYEREAFDLFGIRFNGHPDLRRILTDYGFMGHPFRKDFPLIGEVEVRYDENQKRVVYQPVSITPRVLEPKVIRDDTRYLAGE